jgi:threonine dehydratase
MTGVEHHETKLTRRKVIGVGPEGIDAADRSRHGGSESTQRKVIDIAGGCQIPWTEADIAYGI